MYGPSLWCPMQALVVSKETEKGGAKVNEKRKEQGNNELDVIVIDLVGSNKNKNENENETETKNDENAINLKENKKSSSQCRSNNPIFLEHQQHYQKPTSTSTNSTSKRWNNTRDNTNDNNISNTTYINYFNFLCMYWMFY